MEFKFCIPLNPVPYVRMTQGEVRLMRISHNRVRKNYLPSWEKVYKYLHYRDQVRIFGKEYCTQLNLSQKIQMMCIFYFRSAKHGDPDNCWKAISDALFEDDNQVVGSFDFFIDAENPRIEITLYQK